MARSFEERLRLLVRKPRPSSQNGPSNRPEKFVTMAELVAELHSLLQCSKCHSRENCASCGRLARHWPHLEIKFENTSAPDNSSFNAMPTTCCTVTIRTHYRDSVHVHIKILQVWSYGYCEPEIWQAIAQMIRRVQLNFVPTSLACLSKMEVLEFEGKRLANHPSRDDGSAVSSMDGGESYTKIDIVPQQQQPLFHLDELRLLTIFLHSPKNNCQLQILDLKQCSFENLPFEAFFEAIRCCSTLMDFSLKDCDIMTMGDASWDYEGHDPSEMSSTDRGCLLKFLAIQECLLGKDALESLTRLLSHAPQLQRLVLVQNDWPMNAGALVVESLQKNPSSDALEFLDLSGSLDSGDDSAMQAIGQLLESPSASGGLRQLVLAGNPQVLNVTPIARALETNSSLTVLDLSHNRLQWSERLGQALQLNHTLQSLNLSKAVFLDEEDDDDSNHQDSALSKGSPPASASFFASLGNAHGLKALDLSYVNLSEDCLQELAESLRHNRSLETLQLNNLDRNLGPVRLAPVFAGLLHNSTLRTLEVGRNPFIPQDVEALVFALARNRSLESLTLSGCDLTTETLAPLASRLPDFFLVDLDLSFNAIDKVRANALLEGVRSNHRIRSIALYNSCWSTGGPTHFKCDGFEEENRQIQILLIEHHLSALPFRLEKVKNQPDKIFQLLLQEISHGKIPVVSS